MRMREGDPLPDLELADPDGGVTSLARLHHRHTLLVFLRHLA